MRILLQQSVPVGVRRRCLPFGAACAVLLGLVAGCQWPAADSSGETDAKAGTAPEAPEVTVVKPARKNVRRLIERPGFNIEAYERTALYAKIPGYVQQWNVDIGDHVKKDQVLATLYVPEMVDDLKEKKASVELAAARIKQAEAAKLSAEAQVARTKVQYERFRESARTGGTISPESVEESRLGYEVAKASVEKAKADIDEAKAQQSVAEAKRDYAQTMLAYAEIPAPFDGVVTQRKTNTREFVQPGDAGKGEALYVVDKVDPVRVFVNVADEDAVWVRNDDVAHIRVLGLPGELFKGTVTRTSGSMDPQTRTLHTEIDLRNEGGRLLPGMYADITIIAEHKGVWALPAKAVRSEGDQPFCYRLENGRAVRTPLQVGMKGGDLIEVLKKQVKSPSPGEEVRWENLTGEEEVIAGDPGTLKDDQPVRAVAAKK
jgi:RND family efflux transporter MFP subunit